MAKTKFVDFVSRRSHSDSDVGYGNDQILFIQARKIHDDFVKNVKPLFQDVPVDKKDPKELEGILAMEAESFCGDFDDFDGSQNHSKLKQVMARHEQFKKHFERYEQEMGEILKGRGITFEQVVKNLTKKEHCVGVGVN